MIGPGYLLIKQDIVHRFRDDRVQPETEFAEPPCPLVRVEDLFKRSIVRRVEIRDNALFAFAGSVTVSDFFELFANPPEDAKAAAHHSRFILRGPGCRVDLGTLDAEIRAACPTPSGLTARQRELYLTGLRIEQFHNPTLDPDPYWEEALKRDPGDVRVNTVAIAQGNLTVTVTETRPPRGILKDLGS